MSKKKTEKKKKVDPKEKHVIIAPEKPPVIQKLKSYTYRYIQVGKDSSGYEVASKEKAESMPDSKMKRSSNHVLVRKVKNG